MLMAYMEQALALSPSFILLTFGYYITPKTVPKKQPFFYFLNHPSLIVPKS